MADTPVTTWGGRIHMDAFCNMCDQKKKELNLLAEDSSNIISHEAFRGNDELQRENILGKAMSSESVPHCRELSG